MLTKASGELARISITYWLMQEVSFQMKNSFSGHQFYKSMWPGFLGQNGDTIDKAEKVPALPKVAVSLVSLLRSRVQE